MIQMTSLVKSDTHGKASISQRLILFELISIIKNKLETLGYQKNKLVSYDFFGIKSSG